MRSFSNTLHLIQFVLGLLQFCLGKPQLLTKSCHLPLVLFFSLVVTPETRAESCAALYSKHESQSFLSSSFHDFLKSPGFLISDNYTVKWGPAETATRPYESTAQPELRCIVCNCCHFVFADCQSEAYH